MVMALFMTLAGLAFMRTARTFQRWEGAVLLVSYLAFIAYLLGVD